MNTTSVVKTFRLYRRINQYPDLIGQIHSTFMEVLEQRRIITRKALYEQALEELRADGLPDTETNRQEYVEALIEHYVAHHLNSGEIEAYINLARKRDRCRTLSKVVNRDHVTSMEIYRALRDFCDIPKGEVYISREEAEGIRVSLINHYVSSHLPFIRIAKNHITIRDIDALLQHTLWSRRQPGKLGGKAAGMILAEKILLPTLEPKDPSLEETIRVPETWYLNSGVFSEFVDRNDLHRFRSYKYKDREVIEHEYQHIEENFRYASFAPEVVHDFRRILSEIGEHPIIVRSSSFLEDSFGLAFSGKYLSLFLANQGDLETRLTHFIDTLKRIFASVFGPDPISYRQDHGLLDFDERIAMVVQKVVGRQFGDYFFPFAGGVMFSHNPCAWNPRIRKEEGLMRLVFGLGTRAVGRMGSDYPRMIPLSHPQLRPEVTAEQIRKYSQRQVDVINLKQGGLETIDFRTLISKIDHPDLFYAVSVQKDGHLAPPMFKTDDTKRGDLCVTFDNLLAKTPLVSLAKEILTRVETAYGRPVDMEFAWDGDQLYLLQCRPLSVRKELEQVVIPGDVLEDQILFTTESGLSNSIVHNLEYIVYVDPRAYDRLQTSDEKMRIARVVNLLNKGLAGKRYALMGPGRWGSNDIKLGVRVTYSDINKAKLLVEIAFAKDGYTPEVSYGTHFFQDLVEADITIVPLYPDNPGAIFNEDFLVNTENILESILPEARDSQDVVRVIHVPSARKGNFLHVVVDSRQGRGLGFFGPQDGPRG
jgi:DNA-binding phage protein